MMDKDINDLLKVSEMQIYNMTARVDSHHVHKKVDDIINRFMRRANDRHSVMGRYIPVGLDFSINHIVNSTGQGFFLTDNNISISIPYIRIDDFCANFPEEKKFYRDYLFSMFGYELLWATSIYELQDDLKKIIERFNNDNKNQWRNVKRPISYAFQQIESHTPQPELRAFTSKYQYIGILIFEEISRNRTSFLINSEQVYSVGELDNMVWYWKDGREIGRNLDEDIKKFPEEEGLIFDEPTIIMRNPHNKTIEVIKELAFPLEYE